MSIQGMAQGTVAQYGRKPATSKGPRAIGLIQLFPNGKAHLIPVAISVDGKFFDAGSYKGAPVPMALDFGIVYEGFRAGVSQGIFTITQPGQASHVWMAEGTWLPAGTKAPEKGKKYETPNIEDKDAPPRLHRGDSKVVDPATVDKSTPPASAPSAEKSPASAPKPQESAKVEEPAPPIEDPNRPILRRGKPDPAARRELVKNFDEEETPAKSPKDLKASPGSVQIIPAISDAAGPEPRAYNFYLRPGDEAGYRAKVLELAAAEYTRSIAAMQGNLSARPRKGAGVAKAPAPAFDDVKLNIFDLSNSNDAVLVFSAKIRPHPSADSATAGEGEEITMVARATLEGVLRRIFFVRSDDLHLDVSARMEFIDAIDADGDGRGELLFRRTTDAGTSFAIYRVTPDRLWPLYEGTP